MTEAKQLVDQMCQSPLEKWQSDVEEWMARCVSVKRRESEASYCVTGQTWQ